MRLFIAIQFTENLTAELQRLIRILKQQSRSGNFTRPENLHLTLAFLGETDRAEEAEAVLQAVCKKFPPFPITLQGSGRFGDLYWAGLERNRTLSALAAALQQELGAAGFPIEERPFKPHITLGRRIVPKVAAQPTSSQDQAAIPADPIKLQARPQTMEACWVSLMQSQRIDGRLTYTELASFKLAGMAAPSSPENRKRPFRKTL